MKNTVIITRHVFRFVGDEKTRLSAIVFTQQIIFTYSKKIALQFSCYYHTHVECVWIFRNGPYQPVPRICDCQISRTSLSSG